jgi:hypothetical protein
VAFAELSTERHIGMNVGPIPHSAIVGYAERNGLNDEFVAFARAIRAMDSVYLEYVQTPENERKTVSAQPLSPSVLAAQFGG